MQGLSCLLKHVQRANYQAKISGTRPLHAKSCWKGMENRERWSQWAAGSALDGRSASSSGHPWSTGLQLSKECELMPKCECMVNGLKICADYRTVTIKLLNALMSKVMSWTMKWRMSWMMMTMNIRLRLKTCFYCNYVQKLMLSWIFRHLPSPIMVLRTNELTAFDRYICFFDESALATGCGLITITFIRCAVKYNMGS